MSNNIFILVEGKADITFLRDYLIFLFQDLQPTIIGKNGKELDLKSDNVIIKIKAIGGYTKINTEVASIKEHMDQKYKVLVIQDADDVSKNHGGVNNRIDYLAKIKAQELIEFETFLFPNNQDDGDLEILLLQIVNIAKFNDINRCYLNFIECEKNLNGNHLNELLERKNVIYNYFRMHYGMSEAKEESRSYRPTEWQLEAPQLNALASFLKSYIV